MSQDTRIKLECTTCRRIGYNSTKNKKVIKERLELSKFCKWCRQHTTHKETK
ncbi:TPA: 50S ribosomal protein L33 [Candidatus Uhrbacteria bacterium]|nr:50S ribosomal protein L33 [Candidatus Uhrbacteria bacterium]